MGSQSLLDTDPPVGLADLLVGMYCEGFPSNQKYLPAGAYEDHLNESLVRAELDLDLVNCAEDTTALVQFVLQEAPKIFLALIDLGWSPDLIRRYLKQFQKNDFADARLPVELAVCYSSRAFVQWGRHRQSKMYESQWKYLAPIFSKDKFNPELDNLQPLPFTEIERRNSGATSIVYRVVVHPAHLQDPPLDVSRPHRVPSCSRNSMTDC